MIRQHICVKKYSHPAATIVTMMDVEVLLLCTRTVARIPIMRPHTGLPRSSLFENASPKHMTSLSKNKRISFKDVTHDPNEIGAKYFNAT